MSGILYIPPGPAPNWWLSPAIWVTETTPPYSIVGSPVAGKTYNVQVQVENPYPESVSGGWSLLVFWSVPIVGGFPLAYSTSPPSPLQSENILNGQLKGGYWEGLPITQTVPGPGSVTIQAAKSWTPSFENGGHECLIAFAYLEQATGLPLTTVQGNDPWTQVSTVGQHNLGVLAATHMRHFSYPFRVSNALAEFACVRHRRTDCSAFLDRVVPSESSWRAVYPGSSGKGRASRPDRGRRQIRGPSRTIGHARGRARPAWQSSDVFTGRHAAAWECAGEYHAEPGWARGWRGSACC